MASDMRSIDRRGVVIGVAASLATSAMPRMAMTEPALRTKLAVSGDLSALPGFPRLEFATAWPEQIDWFNDVETVSDFDASGVFIEFRGLWLGYESKNRDQLTFSIYCARIVSERVRGRTGLCPAAGKRMGSEKLRPVRG